MSLYEVMDYENTMCQSNPIIYRWIILCLWESSLVVGVISQVQTFFFLWVQLTCYWIALSSLVGSHYSPKVICNDGLSSMSWSTLCHWLHSAKLLEKHTPCEKPSRAAPDSWTELFSHHVFCLTAYWGMNVLLIRAPGLWPACELKGVELWCCLFT